MKRILIVALSVGATCVFAVGPILGAASPLGPYDRQVDEQILRLKDPQAIVRASAAESLGLLRAYRAERALRARLDDPAGHSDCKRLWLWRGAAAERRLLLYSAPWTTKSGSFARLCISR